MNAARLQEFGKDYTAAWYSQNAASVAAFFAVSGSLRINDGLPSEPPDMPLQPALVMGARFGSMDTAHMEMAGKVAKAALAFARH